MPRLTVITREGAERTIDAESDVSVMENIRAAGFDELLALCGGCCSCATCHVHVMAPWDDVVGPASSDEDDLLESSRYRNETSRLSCQIAMSDALDGLVVRIAPED